jgi:ABC-type spermidine/putrescine transport system permease subunit I
MTARSPGSWRAAAGGWGFVLPALLWTVAFFAMPLAIMGLYSLWQRVGMKLVTDFTTVNYENFFAKSFFFQSLVNSLEVTAIVTVVSILLAYPLAYILAEKVHRAGSAWRYCSPSCRSGPPTSCAPTAGFWCSPRAVSCPTGCSTSA